MPAKANGQAIGSEFFPKLLEAMSGRHAQFDLNLQGITMSLPGTPIGIEISGLVTMTVHMRDMTDGEKKASASKNVALMSMTEPGN
jgi:hypothetical protein